MKPYLLWIVFLLLITGANAQSRQSIRVKAGDDIAQAYSRYGFYRLPQFSKAILYFKTGSRDHSLRYNYNILSGNMQFMSPSGDTLDIGMPGGIDSVVFDDHVFIYKEGFLEKIASAEPVTLVKKTVIKIQAENIGAYGQPNTTASIVNYNSYFSGTNVYNLSINQDIVIAETVSWQWLDTSYNLHKATKANLQKLLPPPKQVLAENYFKQHKVNFEKEKDLQQLMNALK